MTKLLHDFPGYDVIEPVYSAHHRAYILTAGMELANAERPTRHYMISSVVSYALKNNDCPVEAIDLARSRNEALQYVFALGTTLAAGQPKGRYVGVFIGEVYRFEGRYIRFEPAPNDNLKIVDLGDDYAPAYKDNRRAA